MSKDPIITNPSVRLAVADISNARIPGQFRMTLSPGGEWVRHEVVAWSVGMRWLTFGYHGPVYVANSPLFLQGRVAEYLRVEEEPPMEEWMQEHHRRHMVTHQAALLQGLTPGGGNDLPIERIKIDRLLKEMVEREEIDVHGPATALGGNDDYLGFLTNSLEYISMYVDDRRFQLRQLGFDLPVLSTWMPLGDATYCGHALDLHHLLPETLLHLSVAIKHFHSVAGPCSQLRRRCRRPFARAEDLTRPRSAGTCWAHGCWSEA